MASSSRTLRYRVDGAFDLRLVLFSHGWIDLAPFGWDPANGIWSAVLDLDGVGVDLTVRRTPSGFAAQVDARRPLSADRLRAARTLLPYMLRLDADLGDFWTLCRRTPRLAWVASRGAGRIFRSASVFEDLMKLLFTTNCSWAATRLMCQRLVDALGVPAPSGRRAFPSPKACAAADESFYREIVRAGYRARSCVELARRFATGELEASAFTAPDLDAATVRERLLDLPGFGPYAAGQAMRLLGHYSDLALDSWCRARLPGRSDAEIAAAYRSFAPYDGLALWMDLTASWHD